MDANNGPSKTMSMPPGPAAPPPPARGQQASIRSFFQPRTPNYTAPPKAPPTSTQTNATKQNVIPLPTSTTPTPETASSSPLGLGNGKPTIPHQANISPVDPSHIQPLRRINSLLLPINYPDSFYHKILDPSSLPSLSRVILWADSPSTPPKVVGGIVCRLDPSLAPESSPQNPSYVPDVFDIYVQSLVLLSPYRRHGLAAAALKSVIDAATGQTRVKIAGVYAHAWTENTEALEWYAARGFKKEEPVVNGYYRRLKPDSAWILRRRFSIADHLTNSTPSQPPPVHAPPPPGEHNPSKPTAPLNNAPLVQARPQGAPHNSSFQDRRPDREWNDLPEDVLSASMLKPPSASSTRDGSAASSRSSSRSGTKKKKERMYPAAAFGS